MVAAYVKELNDKLNRWETIKKFAILPRDLTIEAGELTPSMKIKRRTVEANFAEQIDKMYEGTSPRSDPPAAHPLVDLGLAVGTNRFLSPKGQPQLQDRRGEGRP